MNFFTANTIVMIGRWVRFVSTMMTIAVMVPAAAMSQSTTVNLGTAGNFVILAKSGISATGVTSITGDIGVSPVTATSITGFGLILDSSGTFSTSTLVVGKVYAAGYTSPTPVKMTTAVSDMQTAYTDAAGRTLPDSTEMGAGDITGRTIIHGLYKWSTGVLVSAGGVTISGSASDIWIFQIAGNLNVADGAIVTLSGGANSSNIYWQVAGQVTLGTTAAMNGIILCQTAIVMSTGATLNGRALAQTAVTLDAATVTTPSGVTAVENGKDLVPQELALSQNYPNPFNPTTTLKYALPTESKVALKVFNVLGQVVATLTEGVVGAGYQSAEWNASNIASGVYFYRIEATSIANPSKTFVQVKKMVLMK